MVKVYMSVNENTEGEEVECCPQCGSAGVTHFEDNTMIPNMPHRCFRCDWKWDGCMYSAGSTPLERLNSVLTL
jgi:hypothetical protein